jgi:hypothetical protein
MLFAAKLQKTHDWLKDRGVTVGPIGLDSGGNQFFTSLDGNLIEMCEET